MRIGITTYCLAAAACTLTLSSGACLCSPAAESTAASRDACLNLLEDATTLAPHVEVEVFGPGDDQGWALAKLKVLQNKDCAQDDRLEAHRSSKLQEQDPEQTANLANQRHGSARVLHSQRNSKERRLSSSAIEEAARILLQLEQECTAMEQELEALTQQRDALAKRIDSSGASASQRAELQKIEVHIKAFADELQQLRTQSRRLKSELRSQP